MLKCCICGDVFDIGYEMPNGDYVCATHGCCYEYCRCEGKRITQESEAEMKTAEYLKQLEDEAQSLLNGDVFSKCDYSTYDSLTENFGELFREIDEQRKVIERQKFVLDVIKDWAYSEREMSVGYTKARMAIQALIRGML